MMIRVYVSTDEQSLFGSEPAPEGYDVDSLIALVKGEVETRYPGAEVEVIEGYNSRVEVDDPEGEPVGMIQDVCQSIVHDAWQEWLDEQR